MFIIPPRLALLAATLVAGCRHGPGTDTDPSFTHADDASVSRGTGAEVVGAGGGDLLVSGSVVRELTDHSDNTALIGASDTHAVITLRRYEAEDATAPLVLAVDRPVRELPIDFHVRGDAAAAFPDAHTMLLVSVTVFQHAGTDVRVGDLTSESQNSLMQAGQTLTIAVSGLEACGAGARGFCTSK